MIKLLSRNGSLWTTHSTAVSRSKMGLILALTVISLTLPSTGWPQQDSAVPVPRKSSASPKVKPQAQNSVGREGAGTDSRETTAHFDVYYEVYIADVCALERYPEDKWVLLGKSSWLECGDKLKELASPRKLLGQAIPPNYVWVSALHDFWKH